jgi:uncharacterized protein YcbK (DUF882 family)
MGDLSKNFSRLEFTCRCGCGLDSIHPDLIAGLQALRDKIGCAIHISSGCRCENHNNTVGGEKNSQHLPKNGCKAADITSRNLTPRQLKAQAEKIPGFNNGGIGLYKGFLHVDVRGYKARW